MNGKPVRTFDFRKFRHGDTFFSRSDNAKSDIIAYAEAWGKGKEGRRRARAAVKDKNYPSHAGSVHESWGQFYPIEASSLGYERGDFDDYRTTESWIVKMYRWQGFEEPRKQRLCANALEYWARKNGNVKYDWWGAITSTRLGRILFPWARPNDYELFCSEGVMMLHVICGLLGMEFPYDTDLKLIRRYMDQHRAMLPKSNNPVDVMIWMQGHPEFKEITGFILR